MDLDLDLDPDLELDPGAGRGGEELATEELVVQVRARLRCGCMVGAEVNALGAVAHHPGQVMQYAAARLPLCLDRLAAAHRCELVSEDNPNGVRRLH